jgi:hypothetical protein
MEGEMMLVLEYFAHSYSKLTLCKEAYTELLEED